MAGYIDEAYFSSINPMNAGQKNGLSAIAPTFGLGPTPKPITLDPQSGFVAPPGFSSAEQDYENQLQSIFNEEGKALTGYGKNHYGGMTQEQFFTYFNHLLDDQHNLKGPFDWAHNGQYSLPGQVNAPDLNPTKAPYFDPYYPNESMLALKNYLAPQMAKNMNEGLNARGLGYSGVGAYANQSAQGALAQLTPMGMTPQDAFVADLARNFGPQAAYSVAQNQVPGAHTPDGFTASNEHIILNNSHPTGPSPTYELTGALGAFPTPGYFYNPNQAPDVSQMPWLNPGTTQPTQPTKPKGNTTFLG